MPPRCPRCGAPFEPLQEYCLQCGARLTPENDPGGAGASGSSRRLPWRPGGAVWQLLLLALVCVASTAAVLSARGSGQAAATTIVVTNPRVTVSPGTTRRVTTRRTATQPTISAGPLPVAPGSPSTAAPTTAATTTTAPRAATTPATTAGPPAHPRAGLVAWPSGRAGYTVVLQSLDESVGRAAADARALAALRAGLPQAGTLLSSSYPSLRAGYWVVFSGIYSSPAAAQAAAATARAHGFVGAYPARVAA